MIFLFVGVFVTSSVALQVRSRLDVLWHQHEHQWIWIERIPNPVHLLSHWSAWQADGLLLTPGHRTENLPSWNAAGHRNLHCHQHLPFQRLWRFLFYFFRTLLFTVNLYLSCRSLAPAFGCRDNRKRLLRGRLHHCFPLHHRALPHGN